MSATIDIILEAMKQKPEAWRGLKTNIPIENLHQHGWALQLQKDKDRHYMAAALLKLGMDAGCSLATGAVPSYATLDRHCRWCHYDNGNEGHTYLLAIIPLQGAKV